MYSIYLFVYIMYLSQEKIEALRSPAPRRPRRRGPSMALPLRLCEGARAANHLIAAEGARVSSAGAVRESSIGMSDTQQQASAAENTRLKCAWCGKHTTTRCSQCHHVRVCSQACMKLMYKTHKRVCVRIRRKPYVTNPESGMYGVADHFKLDSKCSNSYLSLIST